jgi:hypothetical protein
MSEIGKFKEFYEFQKDLWKVMGRVTMMVMIKPVGGL